MNRSELLEKLSRALGVLAYQTRAENFAGMFSKNRLTEDLVLPILSIALNASKLHNLNQVTTNFPYIDLADEQARIAIQVTTTAKSTKVSKTLRNFISHDYQNHYKRLVFFILTGQKIKFATKARRKWRAICGRKLVFDPAADIITIPRLFPLIQALNHPKLTALHDIISQSVVGEAFVDIDRFLADITARQLEYEKKSEKYIPDIFVETRETKNLARSFVHPTLFLRRTVDSLNRLNVPYWNRFLARAGLPSLPFPDMTLYPIKPALGDASVSAAELASALGPTRAVLQQYERLDSSNSPPFQVRPERKYFYEENRFNLQSGLGWGLNRQLEDLLGELAVTQARIFILTGRAGQGKTNLVCDFVERFLFKHGIPCAYLSGRRLRAIQNNDLADGIHRLIFEGKTISFAHAAQLLSAHTVRINKPFVLIVDGLNEHNRIAEFAEQLEQFIETFIRYPNLKMLLTCRSEYFRERFGNLLSAPLKEHIFLLEANENRLEDEAYEEMVAGYFKFFQVRKERVAAHVFDTLKKDVLLLRFFCEAYGAKGKPSGYRQEYIRNIYREQIFEIYLNRKLGTAKAFLRRLTDKPSPTDERAELRAVLEHCLVHMLRAWQFSDVPTSAIPATLHDALYALLDEELILRRDIAAGPSLFSPSSETINFTFDEFRDFLLAQYLLYRVYGSNRSQFEEYIAQNDPKNSQIVEGLKRFLFYASRKKENEEFWNFYRNQNWYKDVYDSEIFNVDPTLIRVEDRDVVVRALEARDVRAIQFTIRLAINWHPIQDRILNLGLLISFVTESDNVRFDSLILPAFTTVSYNEGSSAKGFCKFVSEYILQEFRPEGDRLEEDLFRFLILLFPVDTGVDLNSPSVFTFRNLLDRHPAYAIGLLKGSLSWGPTRHRPYVWRLLASESAPLSMVKDLKNEAERKMREAEENDPVTYREVKRFLDRLSVAASGAGQ